MIAAITEAARAASPVQQKKARTIAELTETVSASRLSTWQRCRLQFYFRYLAGIEKPATPALHVGTTVHTVLQAWNLARWRGKEIQLQDLMEVFNRAWGIWQEDEGIDWKGEEPAAKIAAWNTLQHYLANTPIPADEKPEGVEVGVEADLKQHGLPVLVGVIDLVRAGARIVDFKTSGRTPETQLLAHTTETQVSAYGVLYREATGQKENAIELHVLVKTKTPKFVLNEFGPVSESQVTRLFHVMEAYVDGLEREDFVPSPGLQCVSCEFFHECRAWS